jgi:predicted FMN-binding regulatory protein PaiB
MKHYSNTVQNDEEELHRFVNEMPMANLLTYSTENSLNFESGVFNPVLIDGKYFLHLNRTDDQFKNLEKHPVARLIYFDFLCNIPSYWIDAEDGGVATSYYRHLDLSCDVKIYKEKEELSRMLKLFLTKYQPEGLYRPLSIDETLYQSDYKVLGILELTPKSFVSKWKLGQNREIDKRLDIVQKLKERASGNDLRAAEEILRWINRYQK